MKRELNNLKKIFEWNERLPLKVQKNEYAYYMQGEIIY